MQITIELPDHELDDAIRFTNAKTEAEAIVGAITEFNRRCRMADLTRYAGTCVDLITPKDLQTARRKS